jgi:hypothetical protein
MSHAKKMKTELQTTTIFVFGILQIPMLFLGLVGHFFSFFVFSRKSFTKYSISVYFRAMAISECFVLYRFVYDIFASFFDTKIYMTSSFWCKAHFYVPTAILPTSTWILVAFSIDKTIHALGKRQQFPFIEKKSFQLAIVVGIAVLRGCLYAFLPLSLQLKQALDSNGTCVSSCLLEDLSYYRYLLALVLFEANVIPFCLMLATTIVIVIKLNQSRNNLKRSSVGSDGLRERKMKDVRFAVNSIVLNLLEVMFEMPVFIVHLMNIQNPDTHKLFVTIGVFLFYLSYSITFLVHFTFNPLFRDEFFLMLRINKQAKFHAQDDAPVARNLIEGEHLELDNVS